MARKEEATLLLKIKQQGMQVLKDVEDGFDKIKAAQKAFLLKTAAVGAVFAKFALDASKFDEVKKSFTSLVTQQGKDAKKMIENMKDATRGTVAEMDLMKAANSALLLGLPIDRFDDMLQIARTASKATGESMEFMLQSIVTGLGRGSKLILDNLGIMIDTNKAYEKYAAELGTTADKLDDAQKKQAFINEAMAVGLANAEKLGSSTETLNDKWGQFIANAKNAAISFGQELIPAMEHLLDWANNLTGNENEGLTAVGRILGWIGDAAVMATKFVSLLITSTVDAFTDVGNVISALVDFDPRKGIIKGFIEGFGKAVDVMKENAETGKSTWDKVFKGTEKGAEDAGKKIPKKMEAAGEKSAVAFGSGFEANFAMDDIFSEFAKNMEGMKKFGKDFAENFVPKEGLKSAAKSALMVFGETFGPGIGQLFGEVFELMTMGTEEFVATLDQMFSVEFLENFLINLAVLFTKLPELLINVFEAIVNMLPELIPEVISSMIKAIIVGAPHIIKALIETFGSVNTWKEIGQGIRDGIVQGLKESFKTTFTEAAQVMFEKFVAVFKKLEGTSWDFFGGLDWDIFKLNIQNNVDEIEWFKKLQEEWDKIKGRFKIDVGGVPGVGGGGGGGLLGGRVIKGILAQGGVVPGYATGGILQDDQLIAAQSGEFVINRNSAQENLPLLNAINQSNGPMNMGGGGNNITIVVNGGLLGDEVEARRFAVAVDDELLKLRQDNASVSFDSGVV